MPVRRAGRDSDLIVELDLAVIRRALADLSRWQRSDPALRVHVNLSARHFDHSDCVTILPRAAASDPAVSSGLGRTRVDRDDPADQKAHPDALNPVKFTRWPPPTP